MIIVSAKIEASELNNKTTSSIKLRTIIFTKQNKRTRIYTYSYYFFTMLMHIKLLFLHNAHSFTSFHVGYKVLLFRKHAFQWLHRLNYIVTWHVNPTTTFISFRPWVSTRNRFSTRFRKIILQYSKTMRKIGAIWFAVEECILLKWKIYFN